ncbi:MAG: cob(I)yrinic acid a,c-diamide adenosyltransferase [Candidatus Coatesbacteria bacterium]|nr:cob(I)yrinic acid a,c-diamide adenosyltransferase [Candidatus Coatesbacteria bacterium]
MKGRIQVYTGNGKGKTTAAIGLAIRAAGAGFRVFIAQFLKGSPTSEVASLRRFSDSIELRHFGSEKFIIGKPSDADFAAAREGLKEAREAIASGRYQLVVLDEANVAVHLGLFSVDELISTIAARPAYVEVVVTGRNADHRLIELADLVTEMVEVKHYHREGVEARVGIEK